MVTQQKNSPEPSHPNCVATSTHVLGGTTLGGYGVGCGDGGQQGQMGAGGEQGNTLTVSPGWWELGGLRWWTRQ